MASDEERFDSILLSLAQQHQGGVPELIDTLFGFLRRKTDFFSGGDKAKDLLVNAYTKHSSRYLQEEKKKKQAEEERKRAQKKKEEAEAAMEMEPRVVEIKDEEEPKKPVNQPAKQPVVEEEVAKKETSEEPPKKKYESLADEEDEGKLVPNSGNGSQTDKYVWTQTLSDVEARIFLPEGTRAKFLNVDIKPTHLTVGLKGQPPLVNDDFEKPIKLDEQFWNIEDSKILVISLTKANQMEWWSRLLKSEKEIATRKVQPETSKLDDLDGETRGTVEKMMFDQRQKQMGLPTSDDLSKNEMLQKFMAQHPEMDFRGAKFS